MGTLKIACVGDTMCGDSFYNMGMGVASSLDKYQDTFLSRDIVDILSEHDLVLCNIECVLSDIGRNENSLRSLHMRGRSKTAGYLAKWGVKIAHVANNHILEQGFEAAVDTVQQLEKVGIKVIGTGNDNKFHPSIKPLSITFGTQSISIIGACFHNGKYAFNSNLNTVIQTINDEAAKGNLVIVSVHWGDELIDRPSLWQKQVVQQLVNAGASLVLGHHPHVVQGIDSADNFLVAYSLGNFIFDSHFKGTDWSMILSITISGRRIIRWQAIPIVRGKDYRPALSQGKEKDNLDREIRRRCDILCERIPNLQVYQDEYMSELKTLETKCRRQLWLHIIKNFPRYRPIFWPQILLRPIQRRLGIW